MGQFVENLCLAQCRIPGMLTPVFPAQNPQQRKGHIADRHVCTHTTLSPVKYRTHRQGVLEYAEAFLNLPQLSIVFSNLLCRTVCQARPDSMQSIKTGIALYSCGINTDRSLLNLQVTLTTTTPSQSLRQILLQLFQSVFSFMGILACFFRTVTDYQTTALDITVQSTAPRFNWTLFCAITGPPSGLAGAP